MKSYDQIFKEIGALNVSSSSKQSMVASDLLEEHIKETFGDQKGQVNFLINHAFDYSANGLPRNGYFVDLACADGVKFSNTYFLEKYLNWSGILFEPNPMYQESISTVRINPIVTQPVTDRRGEWVPFRVDNGMLGGIVSEETENNEKVRGDELKNATIIDLKSTTLDFELRKHNAPAVIDFMSLDVEGAEFRILRNFPFHEFQFRAITVERPTPELDVLLDRWGYRQVAHLAYDVFYVHKDFLPSVNFHPKVKFAMTPRKDW